MSFGLFAAATSAFGQGSLTPPGAPAPSMRTLEQIEPRIPISSVGNGIYISTPGSYYLTTNIVAPANSYAISINTNNVRLDMRGWTLYSAGGSTRAINANTTLTNVYICNGSIVGFSNGSIVMSVGASVHVQNVKVQNCSGGILLGNDGRVENCHVTGYGLGTAFAAGKQSILTDCVADNCGFGFSVGDHSVLKRCVALNNTTDGLGAGSFSIVSDCLVVSNVHGLYVGSSTRVDNNVASYNVQDGITVQNDCLVLNNIASGNQKGIVVNGFDNRIEGNTAVSNSINGIYLGPGATNNVVTRNLARRNALNNDAANYSIVAGNDVGPIGSVSTNTSPWANIR